MSKDLLIGQQFLNTSRTVSIINGTGKDGQGEEVIHGTTNTYQWTMQRKTYYKMVTDGTYKEINNQNHETSKEIEVIEI